MDFPNVKDLKKLAAACRKAGILNLKVAQDGSFEFSLDPSLVPQKNSKVRAKAKQQEFLQNSLIETDSLTEEQLLMWSVNDPSVSTGTTSES